MSTFHSAANLKFFFHLLLFWGPIPIDSANCGVLLNIPVDSGRDPPNLSMRNNANQATLLNSGAPDLRRDSEVPDAVISTWEISFIQIRQQCLPAANLLSLMSLFNRQGIPEILIKPKSHDHDSQSKTDEDLRDPEIEFETAIALLIAFSLVRTETNRDLFEIHRLVQVATRRWLESNGSIQQWKSNAIAKMADTMPNGEYETWKTCAILLPHAKEVIAYQATDVESKLQRASVLQNVGWYESRVGNFGVAAQMSEEALCVRPQFLDKDDNQVSHSMNSLALTYWNQGRWKDAEELFLQALEVHIRVLGEWHPNTLINMSNLALVFKYEKRWNEAEDLLTKVIEKKKMMLGAEHPNALTSMSILASVFHDQERWKEAEDLLKKVTEKRKMILGAEHPDTLASMNNLASVFHCQERLKEAGDLCIQVMETAKRVLGAEHPSTLISMANLADVYEDQAHSERAVELMTIVAELSPKVLGQNHPHTIDAIEYLKLYTST